jgi:OmpA-OmpF porin, OOP family
MFRAMNRVRTWWWGLPVVALGVLGVYSAGEDEGRRAPPQAPAQHAAATAPVLPPPESVGSIRLPEPGGTSASAGRQDGEPVTARATPERPSAVATPEQHAARVAPSVPSAPTDRVAVAAKPERRPYGFTARREDGKLILAGSYPDAAAHAAIVEEIRGLYLTDQVVDGLQQAEGAPDGYLQAVRFGLAQLALLAAGEAVVSGKAVRLAGEALYEQTAERTHETVRGFAPPGWTGEADIKARRPAP